MHSKLATAAHLRTEDRLAGQVDGTLPETRQQFASDESAAQPSTSQTAAQARPTLAAQNSSHVTAGAAVYIGNLQWWTTDADLESLCSKYGQILSLKTFEDKTTGKSKGYVLVHFMASDAAAACQAELNG